MTCTFPVICTAHCCELVIYLEAVECSIVSYGNAEPLYAEEEPVSCQHVGNMDGLCCRVGGRGREGRKREERGRGTQMEDANLQHRQCTLPHKPCTKAMHVGRYWMLSSGEM